MPDGIDSPVDAESDVTRAPADVSALDPRFELEDVLNGQRCSFVADGPPGLDVRRNRIDRLMALVLDNTDAFLDAITGSAAPPFRKPMKIYPDTALRLARNRTRRRLAGSRNTPGEGEQR